MFSTIFKYELKYWFKKPAFYIYAAIFFLIGILFSASAAGIFDSVSVSTGSSKIVNSPGSINGMFNALSVFIYFLFPSIIGVSIYRDYKSNMHSILYSYPFTKANYLFAKFFSAIVIILLIVTGVGMGIFIGFRLPGTNSELISSFHILSYLYSYFIFIIPNALLFGAIVFAVVTFTRNISAGFITVVLLLFIQGLAGNLLNDSDNKVLAALLDPFGSQAIRYYTEYWTVAEKNEQYLPFTGYIIYNRLLWLSVASLVFGFVYKKFQFRQNAISFSFKKEKAQRIIKSNFGGITRINLPKVNYNYSFIQNLKTSWSLSKIDLKYIIKSWPFISIVLVGLIFILLSSLSLGQIFHTKTYPVTWQMLAIPGGSFSLFINILTFLYAGMLVHRSRIENVNHIIDVTPIPNWSLLLSKFIALVKMQVILLIVIMIGGMMIQIYHGYYEFEIGHYLFELYGLKLIHFVIWAMLSLLIQTLFKNPYLGLFAMLIISIGIPFLSKIGIEQAVFRYNDGSGYNYSAMNGYNGKLPAYFIYKFYWLLNGGILLIIASLFWVRGIPNSFKERLSIAKSRFNTKTIIGFSVLLIAFIGLGSKIYYENNILNKYKSSKDRELSRVTWEKSYKKYENAPQPRIVAVNVNLDIYPKTLDFKANGTYKMINKTNQAIDSIFLNHNQYISTFTFNKENTLVMEDTIQNFDIYQLKTPLQPGEKLELAFTIKNKENTLLKKHSPLKENGSFINSSIFPSLGYDSGGELQDDKIREKYGLPKNDLKPYPTDSTALGNTYISHDSDWIDFEATVSTSEDQIAIAPGYLQKEWIKDGRRYFHYKMDSKILNFYAFNSAKYEIAQDKWNDVKLEIYYHKGHEYNLDRMFKGVKASLAYNSDNFSPYQHKQLRIIEFPGASFAQSFPNTIPFSENIGFIADVDDSDEGGVDYPFAVTAHEVAHQWWAHQVIGADVLGATMLSESMSEYVSLKVLEHTYGKDKMRKFLKSSLDKYLRNRTFERKREKPLMYNDGQTYIRYQKGSLILYALSDYIGEEKLNNALKQYVEKVKFQEPPYTTSIEMVDYIKKAVPDSLQYTIKDMFETITLYKNRIENIESKKLDNGKYEVEIEFNVSKYRNNEKGKKYYSDNKLDSISYKSEKMKKPIYSVPLTDYIEIGVFGEEEIDGKQKEKILYLKKHKITSINNKITLIVDEEPKEVGVDPFNKLIDTNSNDNRRGL